MATTHEREITEPVRLCEPDGRHLDPCAVGWSRTPLHDCNLSGVWGRTKKWDYWAVLTGDFVFSVTYADVDYIGLATIWWADLASGETGGREVVVPLARGISLPDRPGTRALVHRDRDCSIEISDDDRGTRLFTTWTEADGRHGAADILVELPEGHESLNVVIPWSRRRFQYTSKHQARPAHGTFAVGDLRRIIGSRVHSDGQDADGHDSDSDPGRRAWGVLDVGRGRWPYSTRWNWGGGAGSSTRGHTVGLQFGGLWTRGTGFTENGVIVDGRLTKIGTELDWDYDWDDPLAPWRVRDRDGSLEVTLSPVHDRHSRVELAVMGTEVHQVFGTWSGHFRTEQGEEHEVRDIPGFAEESRSRW